MDNKAQTKSTSTSFQSSTPHHSVQPIFEKNKQRGVSNPSLYDIKSYFQGVNEAGRMNNSSKDEKYNLLISNLRENLEILGDKIQPKVYEYGFLK